MHYGATYFSKEKGKQTLIPKMKGEKLGQRRMLSQTDCLKVNELYGCLDDIKMVWQNFNLFFLLTRKVGILHAISFENVSRRKNITQSVGYLEFKRLHS
jgi:hypothetical protein